MEIRLPSDKLARIQKLLKTWLTSKKANKRQILSLVGTFQHATKVVRPGRAFGSRMYSTAAKLVEMYFITWLNKAFWSDLLGGMPSCNLGMASVSFDTLLPYHTQIFLPRRKLQGHGVAQQYWDLSGYIGNSHQNGMRLG